MYNRTRGEDSMKKDHLNPYDHDYDTKEEKEQAEKEDKLFRRLMSCSTILTGLIVLIILFIFVFLYFFN